MADEEVILTVTAGSHSGQQFVLRGTTQCLVGRASDCAIRLAGGVEDWLVSRHHCQVDVEPEGVRIQDLGSRNGTFLNGRRVAPFGPIQPEEHQNETFFGTQVLKDGDELRVGPVPLRVTIKSNPQA
jgi:pSer/pThr/pTyr-binding forkhead associated (FHA) protein